MATYASRRRLTEKCKNCNIILKYKYSPFSTCALQSDAYWWFVSVCTTGHWQMSRFNIGEHVSRGASFTRYALKWFVRYDITKTRRALYRDFFGVENKNKVSCKYLIFHHLNDDQGDQS